MVSQLSSGRSAIDRLIGLPGALVDSLRILPEIGRHTARLHEMQRHLDQLPDTMGGLDEKISRLSALIEEMLTALDGLGANVEALRSGMGPLSRLAGRVPGQRKDEQPQG